MTPDMKRLAEAVKAAKVYGGKFRFSDEYAEAIVRAVLTELREVSPEGFEVMEAAMKRPRIRVGHKASDDARGAYLALDAYVDHILDTKARREAALSDLAQMDGDLL